MSTEKSERLIILEGPDGGGKSTLAAELSTATGAVVARHGVYSGVSDGPTLARLYLESMLPALLGHAPVILDRSWLSEFPYATVMRGGRRRIDDIDERMLERAAWRCGALVVRCLPPLAVSRATWESRRGDEYLDAAGKLEAVRDIYVRRWSSLPTVDYDYTSEVHRALMATLADRLGPRHALSSPSAGNLNAPAAIVGDSFGERRDGAGYYRLPFLSFRRGGTARWFTDHLSNAGVGEEDVLWTDADQRDAVEVVASRPRRIVVALGAAAASRLAEAGVRHRVFTHPSHPFEEDGVPDAARAGYLGSAIREALR